MPYADGLLFYHRSKACLKYADYTERIPLADTHYKVAQTLIELSCRTSQPDEWLKQDLK